MSKRKKKIVCLGGGKAMPDAVLSELKKYPINLSVICSMLDSGGSSGRLRQDYKVVSPGDIRRSFIALAKTSPAILKLLKYRFQKGELKGHNFANLLIVSLFLSNNPDIATKEMSRILNIEHSVIPATFDNSQICAILENNKIIRGETNIDIPKHDGRLKIKRAFLKPKARAHPKALNALQKADFIIIGPGDLYSSLVQILLVEGISKAIKKSKAKIIYICNPMTKYGETNNFTVLDFVKELEKYLKKELNYVIYNNSVPKKEIVKKYRKKYPALIELVKINKCLPKEKFIGKNLLLKKLVEYNSKKLTKVIMNLCKQ